MIWKKKSLFPKLILCSANKQSKNKGKQAFSYSKPALHNAYKCLSHSQFEMELIYKEGWLAKVLVDDG